MPNKRTMYQKQKKLALYVILGLSFLPFSFNFVFAEVIYEEDFESGSFAECPTMGNVTSGSANSGTYKWEEGTVTVNCIGVFDIASEGVIYTFYVNEVDPSSSQFRVIDSGSVAIFEINFLPSSSNVYLRPIADNATNEILIGTSSGWTKIDVYVSQNELRGRIDDGTWYTTTVSNTNNGSGFGFGENDHRYNIDDISIDDGTDFFETRIIDLDPAQASTTPSGNPVYINAVAYIAEESSFWDTIKINLWTRDENSVLSRLVFTYQTDLYTVHFNGTATSTGLWQYSSTTMLDDGNYTIQFSLGNSTLGGLIPNPFGGDTQTLTHQFTVGSSTFLGNLNQTVGQDIEDILQGKTATSTQVLLDHCKPWSEAGFDVVDCLSGLLIPDKGKMMELFEDFKLGIVYKFPWGYGFRFFALATGGGTTTPPTLGFSIPDDEFFPVSLRNKDFSLNPWSALSSTSPLTTADGFGSGNLMDTVMPYWNIIIYGMVVIGVTKKVLMYQSERTIESDIQYGKDREFQGRMGKIRRKMLNEDWRIRNRYSNKKNT